MKLYFTNLSEELRSAAAMLISQAGFIIFNLMSTKNKVLRKYG